jgi:hypothetical protein
MHENETRELMGDEPVISVEELASGGFSVIDRTGGGMVAHRGTLHPDEYIDRAVLREATEEALGFTHEEVSSAYAYGRPTTEQRQLRERIDSRLLALSRSGGRMASLAMALDIGTATLERALARATRAEVAPIVRNPAVRSNRVCFKCGDDGAKARKRRHSRSPEQWVGSVDLCDGCYSAGFETQPGNPRYWEHRLSVRPVGA